MNSSIDEAGTRRDAVTLASMTPSSVVGRSIDASANTREKMSGIVADITKMFAYSGLGSVSQSISTLGDAACVGCGGGIGSSAILPR